MWASSCCRLRFSLFLRWTPTPPGSNTTPRWESLCLRFRSASPILPHSQALQLFRRSSLRLQLLVLARLLILILLSPDKATTTSLKSQFAISPQRRFQSEPCPTDRQ
ncbi:unnamed protein product [Linum tenue]|uniref:Secreted protein n=1 Tax=Linum tenue TaxID=586396 RepID=A0AAV0QTT4_9ROSI|nr:unnamed protein product [Linum tenue]